MDLELSGVDDGLHNFGQGIWMFHDHVEKSFTTNGMVKAAISAWSFIKVLLMTEVSLMLHGMSLAPYFTKGILAKEISYLARL